MKKYYFTIFLYLYIFRELTSRGKEQANKDLRSELGYRLSVQVDVHDAARPLAVVHVPSLGNKVNIFIEIISYIFKYNLHF